MYLLHSAKLICSNVLLFDNEVKNLCIMFLQNGYSKNFFNHTLKKFKDMAIGQTKPETIRIFRTK